MKTTILFGLGNKFSYDFYFTINKVRQNKSFRNYLIVLTKFYVNEVKRGIKSTNINISICTKVEENV